MHLGPLICVIQRRCLAGRPSALLVPGGVADGVILSAVGSAGRNLTHARIGGIASAAGPTARPRPTTTI
jgi:hypothetical protein